MLDPKYHTPRDVMLDLKFLQSCLYPTGPERKRLARQHNTPNIL